MYEIALTKAIKRQLKPALWGNAEKAIFTEIQAGISQLYLTDNKNMLVVARMELREFVVVAIVGKDLKNNRRDIINHAIANGAMTIRIHTKNPKHLEKGLAGLQILLHKRNARLFGNDELIYKMSVA
jgi:hypothetical protein